MTPRAYFREAWAFWSFIEDDALRGLMMILVVLSLPFYILLWPVGWVLAQIGRLGR